MRRPNVVLIVLDTVRASGLDLYGYHRETMPHLRRFAERGVSFTRAFSTSCWTLPAHASLFTGLLPSRHGCHETTRGLPRDRTTLAERLAAEGYATAAFTNNAWIGTHSGLDRGFTTFFKGWQIIQSKSDVTRARADAEGKPEAYSIKAVLRNLVTRPSRGTVVDTLNAAYARLLRNRYDSGARRMNREIARWLRERSGPFLLFINYLEAHVPYAPPRPYRKLFLPGGTSERAALSVDQSPYAFNAGADREAEDLEIFRALYDAELRYLDARLGELLALVAGDDDTAVVIVGDHGEAFGEHHLMGHMYNLYEPVLHVPFVVVYPRRFPAGRRAEALVHLADVVPTVLDCAGLGIPPGLDGASVAGMVDGPGRSFVCAELMGPMPPMHAVLRQAPDAVGIRRFDRQLRAVRTDRHKLIVGSDGTVELYDLVADPGEDRNVAADRPDLVADLRALISSPLDAASGERASEMDEETRRALRDLGYLT